MLCAVTFVLSAAAACAGSDEPELRVDPEATVATVAVDVPAESGWVGPDGPALLFVSLTVRDGSVTGFAESAQLADPTVRETSEIAGEASGQPSELTLNLRVGDETWSGSVSVTAMSIDITDVDGSPRHVDLVPGNADTFNEELSAGS